MNIVRKAYLVARHMGPGFVATRVGLLVDKKLGGKKRRFASRSWDEIDRCLGPMPSSDAEYFQWKRQQRIQFLFPFGNPPPAADWTSEEMLLRNPGLAKRIELLREGRLTYFLDRPSPSSVDWYKNPFDGGTGEADLPWFEIPDFAPGQGDARMLWEPSRAAWAIDLARAEAKRRTGLGDLAVSDPGFAEMFWRLVESWMDACPPWRGFQWKCGQESSVRFLAITIGAWAFANDSATTPERWKKFGRLAWATGYRVFHHIAYAVSQKNNHSLSEACGLMLVAHLFPEFPESGSWCEKGRAVIEQELPAQIFDDGSYIQHSMNYTRVVLHVCLVAFRIAELAGRPFDRALYERLGIAGAFLHAMMDPTTGEVPRYGHNDGACVLPLNECRFWDFRPVVGATHFLVNRKLLFGSGPWNEDLAWLFGVDAKSEGIHDQLSEAAISKSNRFDVGGYYTLRQGESWAMIRCHTYRSRPGQCDSLHCDLWWRGLNVLRDCGTYQYYVPNRPALEHYFGSLAAHNSIQVDRAEPFERVSRFLWFPWPQSKMTRFCAEAGTRPRFEGESQDYNRNPWNVVHRRTIIGAGDDVWVVLDDLYGAGNHTAVLRWHMMDSPCAIDSASQSLELSTPAGLVSMMVQTHPCAPARFELIRGRQTPESVQGIAADQYGQLNEIPTLEVEVSAALPMRFITVLGLGKRILPGDVDAALLQDANL